MSDRGRVVLAGGALLVALAALRLLGVVVPTRAEDRVAPTGALLGVPALAALDGVALGMSPRALRRARPVEPAPYVGLAEPVGGVRVEYRFGGDATRVADLWRGEDGDVPPWLRLASVEARVEHASTAAADSLWADVARRLAASAPGAVRCFAYRHGSTPAVAAVQEADGRAIVVARYPRREERSVDGPLVVPATVRAAVARDVALVVPAPPDARTPFACPATP